MSVNSSYSSNASLPPSSLSSFNGMYLALSCFESKGGTINITIFTITTILLLLPLYIFIIYLGLQQWRQQHSFTTMNHSDVFTFHMIFMELMNVLGSTLICCGVHTKLSPMVMVGVYFLVINVSGQMFFHTLTCVERYLAVVRPITYRNLKETKGIRIRNIMIGCSYLGCIAATGGLHTRSYVLVIISSFLNTAFFLIVIPFFSFSVLCFLIHPGPGEGGKGGGRQCVDQSKLRAFYTITAIMGVLLIRIGGFLLVSIVSVIPWLGQSGKCAVWLNFVWFCIPSSLVLPLLYLQRAGKLRCCKSNSDHLISRTS